MAWRAHSENIVLVRPMYHVYPLEDRSYCFQNQYFFGSELIVSPFIAPMDKSVGLSRTVVWLPSLKSDQSDYYYDFSTGRRYFGGKTHVIYGELSDIPVFAMAGAIVPLAQNYQEGVHSTLDTALHVKVFAGADRTFELYEDDGESQSYRSGMYYLRALEQKFGGDRVTFTVHPTVDHGAADRYMEGGGREVSMEVVGVKDAKAITFLLNGQPIRKQPQVSYVQDAHTLTVEGVFLAHTDTFVVTVRTNDRSTILFEETTSARRNRMFSDLVQKIQLWSPLKEFLGSETQSPRTPGKLLKKLAEISGRNPQVKSALTDGHLRAMAEVLLYPNSAGIEVYGNTISPTILKWNDYVPNTKDIRYRVASTDFKGEETVVYDGKQSLPEFECVRLNPDLVQHLKSSVTMFGSKFENEVVTYLQTPQRQGGASSSSSSSA
eukprot:TRINITY_DN929_c2_g1_i1.p1 TRINITY_DN929_c2_g1~~TRINITY_DN929_c2_g1_i1.p1  ORF type:complete len:485 (-),score=103.88 TRINITY_DN929_c2_g1_i1:156-1460(-)